MIYEVDINFKESIIGKNITIPHFENQININTKNFGIINPSKTYIIENKGLINDHGNKGNLLVKFNIDYESYNLTNEKIEILKNIL